MRLLLATSSYPLEPGDGTAAAGLFVRDIACALRDRSHDVTVLTQRRPGRTGDDPGIRVVRFPWWGRASPVGALDPTALTDIARGAALILLGSRALSRVVRIGRFDGVLAFWALPSGAWAMLGETRARVPYDCWVLGSDIWRGAAHPWTRPLLRRVLRGARHLFADGDELAHRATEVSGRPATLLHSVRMPPASAPTPPPGRNRFVFIGRWERAKGADLVPAAAEILRQAGWEFEIEMRGLGRMEGRIRADVRRLGLGGRVVVRGPAATAEAARLIGSADWVVIPSRQESIPLILWDALQGGRPVVATDVGDLGPAVRRLGVGILARAPTPIALARAMAEAAGAGAGRYLDRVRHAMKEVSLEKATDRLLAVMQGGPDPAGRTSRTTSV